MGRVFLIGVVVMTVILTFTSVKMNEQLSDLPQITTNDLSRKETQNLMNYAIRYGLRFAEDQSFPKVNGFKRMQRFNNFYYRYGYIDSIEYRYLTSSGSFQIIPYIRTTVNGKASSYKAHAGISDITSTGGKGNVIHLSFENDFLDSSSNHNDGYATGSIRFKGNGMANNCIWPSGSGQYITVPDSPTLDLTPTFSIVVWPNWNSNPNGWIPIIWKSLNNGATNYASKPAYGMWLYQDYLYGCVTLESGTYLQAVSNTDIKPQGNWHFVAMTYGKGTLRLYYDGTLTGSATGTTGQPYNSIQSLSILTMPASASGGTQVCFKGRFDEIGIYDYMLDDAQILSIWNSPNGILPVGSANPKIDFLKE